jgi:hypothetical protein
VSSPPKPTRRLDSHENLTREEKVEGSSDRAFGITFAVVFGIIAAWPVIWWRAAPIWWALGVAGVFLAVGLVAPTVLGPLNKLWLRFGLLLHHIITPIVMGLIFFVAVTPTGLILRAMGKDMLRLKPDPAAKSYWIHRTPPGPAPGSIRNQF